MTTEDNIGDLLNAILGELDFVLRQASPVKAVDVQSLVNSYVALKGTVTAS